MLSPPNSDFKDNREWPLTTDPEETLDQGNNPLSSRGGKRRIGCSGGVGAG